MGNGREGKNYAAIIAIIMVLVLAVAFVIFFWADDTAPPEEPAIELEAEPPGSGGANDGGS